MSFLGTSFRTTRSASDDERKGLDDERQFRTTASVPDDERQFEDDAVSSERQSPKLIPMARAVWIRS